MNFDDSETATLEDLKGNPVRLPLTSDDLVEGKYYRAIATRTIDIREGEILRAEPGNAVMLLPEFFEAFDEDSVFTTYSKLNVGDKFVSQKGREHIVRDKTDKYIIVSSSRIHYVGSVDDEDEDEDDTDESDTSDPFNKSVHAIDVNDKSTLYVNAAAYRKYSPDAQPVKKKKSRY